MHPRREPLSCTSPKAGANGATGAYEGDAGSARAGPAASARKGSMEKQNYYDEAIGFASLYRALDEVCRGVRWKDSVVGYEHHGLVNTLALRDSLRAGTYKISRYQEFTVYEPKERRIIASRLVDRQFQRSLRNAGLYRDIVEHFIRDNIACQEGRGVSDAHKRLKTHLRRYYAKHGCEGWVLKCDIRHFFPSTRHDVAKAAVCKYVSDPRAAKAVCDVIDSFGGDCGLGLGSEISQLVELLVLNDVDHLIKERLRARYYIRYMDDLLIISPDRGYLQECLAVIGDEMVKLGFQLNDKTCIYPLRQGVKFLRWRYIVTGTGKVLMLLDKAKIHKEHRRLKKLWAKEAAGQVEPGTTSKSLEAWCAAADIGDTHRQQLQMIEFYHKLITSGGIANDRELSQAQAGGGSGRPCRAGGGDHRLQRPAGKPGGPGSAGGGDPG